MNLISYKSIYENTEIYAYDITDNIADWLLKVDTHPETYIILNVIPLSDEDVKKLNNNLKNM